MAETTNKTPPQRGRKWLRIVAGSLLALGLLLVIGYFVVTSSGFFKSVILPRASKALNAQITVSDASIRPFSQVVLRNLKVQTTGPEPLLVTPELRLRYGLGDILGGKIKVNELTIKSPTVVVVTDASGKSNLDPILQSQSGDKDSGAQIDKADEPLQLDVTGVRIENATIRYVQETTQGKNDVSEISGFELTLNNLRNGESGKLGFLGNFAIQRNGAAPAEAGNAQGKATGDLNFALTPQLGLASAKGNVALDLTKADGVFAQANGLGATLVADVSPTEVQEIALKFARQAMPLAQLRAYGPFSFAKNEGTLTIELGGLDKQLLNLAGASSGLDFRSTRVTSTNQLVMSQGGQLIKASGQLNLGDFQVTRTNQTTPMLQLRAQYDSAVDLAKSNAVLGSFVLTGTQNGKPLLEGNLSSPFTYDWGRTGSGVGDSTLAMKLSELNLADWKPFVGDYASSGLVSGQLQLRSQNSGKRLAFDLQSQASNLTITAGSDTVSEGGLKLQLVGVATNQDIVSLETAKFDFSQRNQLLVSAAAKGLYTVSSGSGDFQILGQAEIPTATRLVPLDADFSSGRADFNARITRQGDVSDVLGSLSVTNLTGRYGSNHFQSYFLSGDFQLGMAGQQIQIRKLSATPGVGSKSGGRIDLTGTYALSNNVAALNLKLSQLTQDALQPFLDPMMEDMKVRRITVNGDLAAQYRPDAESVIQTSLAVTNLVLSDSEYQISPAPLEVSVKADATLLKDIAELKRVELLLSPSRKATTNRVVLTGRLDLSSTNGIQGQLQATANDLDITRYYDVYMGEAPVEVPELAKPADVSVTPPEEELEPLIMPVRNLVTQISVGRLYLRELEMTNAQTKLLLDGGRVVLEPFQFGLNGAQAKTSLKMDMGVPGWKYELEFNTIQAPVKPLVDSFMPDLRGQVGGQLTAALKVGAQGITDTNLQKTLNGNFDISTTNLNVAVPTLRNPLIKTIVSVVGLIPDILKNPRNQVGALAGALLGGAQAPSAGGVSEELMASPIDVIDARGFMKPGIIELERSLLQSAAFQASAAGRIETRPILSNSPVNIPLTVALRRSIAEKINLVPAGTPTNAVYVTLPNFVTVKGTIGEPKNDINYAALAGTALQQFGGKIPGVDQKTSNLIQGLGNILGGAGTGASNTPAGATNVPPARVGTNTPAPSRGLLGGLESLLGAPRAATNAPTGAPAVTNTSPAAPAGSPAAPASSGTNTLTNSATGTNAEPIGALLDQLLRKKK